MAEIAIFYSSWLKKQLLSLQLNLLIFLGYMKIFITCVCCECYAGDFSYWKGLFSFSDQVIFEVFDIHVSLYMIKIDVWCNTVHWYQLLLAWYIRIYTVKQDISADTLFPRLGDFAVPRILIFADAGTEHSSFIVLLSHISYFYWIIRKSRRPQFLFLALNILRTRVLYYTSEAMTV